MHQDLSDPAGIDSFDPDTRLAVLARAAEGLAAPGCAPDGPVNMHLHSFYSYNSMGYSPSHLALVCRRQGLYAAALCDFDVLDGLEEFLAAGQLLGLRAAVHLETRAFLREYAAVDINSPGEPGVTYIMGAGFGALPPAGSRAMRTLDNFRQQANLRNRALVARVNGRLPEIALDYDRDVLPLSPGGCPTERHIVRAYREKARSVFSAPERIAGFWSGLMRKSAPEVAALLEDSAALDDKIRSLLAKSGGIGYVRPDDKTFPPVDDFVAWVLECNAIPMATWLDGTSAGEANMPEMLSCLRAKGVAAINIIPDRNHNIKNENERRLKLAKLSEVVAAARQLHFPVNIGTEMNKHGQPFADDTACAALAPYREDFMRGANIMIGHSVLARYAFFSYCGRAAEAEYGKDTGRKNKFFESVGKLPPLAPDSCRRLGELGPDRAFQLISSSASAGRWMF